MSMIQKTLDYLEEAQELKQNVYEKLNDLSLALDDAERSSELFMFAKDSANQLKEEIISLGLTFDPSVFGSSDEIIQRLLDDGSSAIQEMSEIASIIRELNQKFV